MTDPIRKPAQTPGLTVQFFLKHGSVVHWPVPTGEPFSFPILVQSIRSAGYFIMQDCYIPADEIAIIGMAGTAAKIQQAPHPTRQ